MMIKDVMFLKETAKEGQSNRKIGGKWEKHKKSCFIALFGKGHSFVHDCCSQKGLN